MVEKELVVIGAGIGRTGTTSLRLALEELVGPTYHMFRMLESKGNDDANFWLLLNEGKASDEAFKSFISSRGLAAVLDFPMSFYWKKLVKLYPDAKVILTIRSPESWYKSFSSTIYQLLKTQMSFPVSWLMWLTGMGKKVEVCRGLAYSVPDGLDMSPFAAIEAGEKQGIEFFNKWNAHVRANVPRDHLLVFEAKEGWEPLCKFLDVPIPDHPFPRENDSKSFQGVRKRLLIISYSFLLVASVLSAVGITMILTYFS